MTDRHDGERGATGRNEADDHLAAASSLMDRTLLSLRHLSDQGARLLVADALVRVRASLLECHVLPMAPIDGHLEVRRAVQHAQTVVLAAHEDRAVVGDRADAEILARVATALNGIERLFELLLVRGRDGVSGPAPSAPRDFRASRGVPTAHAVVASRRIPRIGWPEDDELSRDPPLVVATPDAWLSWVPSGAPSRRAIVVPRGALRAPDARVANHARDLARRALFEVGAMSQLRLVGRDNGWFTAERSEERLLAAFDAFAALESSRCEHHLDAVDLVLDWADDAPAPDEARAFTRAFVLGSLTSPGAVADALWAIRQSSVDTRSADCLGLCLAAAPAVGPALRALLADDDPAMVALAAEAARFRGDLELSEALVLVAHPDVEVATAAVRAMGQGRGVHAVEALVSLLGSDRDDAMNLVVAETLRRLGSSEGVVLVRQRLREDVESPAVLTDTMRAAYAMFLAIAGERDDAELLQSAAHGDSEVAWALGWHGHSGHVEPLIEMLGVANELRRSTGPAVWRMELVAAEALHRITGAPLIASEAPQLGIDFAAMDPESAAKLMGDPELRAEGERMAELDAWAGHFELDARVWAEWWAAEGGRFQRGQRYRFGEPYGLRASVEELADPDCQPTIRKVCAREVGLFLPEIRIETADWVVRQRAGVARAREACGAVALPRGGWATHGSI
jgi:hypothetical protein